ncbi:hypothetical protein Bca4012_096678 [Brassica carinata]
MYLPDIICLSETKQKDDYVRDVGAQLGFPFSSIVTPVGVGGGLVVYWKQSVQVSVLSQSCNLIDCKVISNEVSFYLSFVYGHPNPAFRHHTWERLMRCGLTRRNEPWFTLGDFNEIVGNHEKIGGRIRPKASFQDFRDMRRTCGFQDLQTLGNKFSWIGQRGNHRVQCCLDRTMATSTWFDKFPASQTEFLEIGESDHRPLVTYIETEQLLRIPLAQTLSRCRQHISVWKRHNRSNAEDKIGFLRRRLDQAMVSDTRTQQERAELKEELNQASLEEEIFWKQESRVMWLRAGDRNTRFFHAVTKAKRIKNTLHSIQDHNGVIHRGQKEVAQVAECFPASSPSELLHMLGAAKDDKIQTRCHNIELRKTGAPFFIQDRKSITDCCSRLLFITFLCALTIVNDALSPDGEALVSFRSGVSKSDGVISHCVRPITVSETITMGIMISLVQISVKQLQENSLRSCSQEVPNTYLCSTILEYNYQRLEGKIVVITGGASGIGAEAARLFTEHGARVVITDVKDELGRNVTVSIGEDKVSYFHCDVRKETEVESPVKFTVEKHGRIDVLFSNAGVPEPLLDIRDLNLEAFDRVMASQRSCAVWVATPLVCEGYKIKMEASELEEIFSEAANLKGIVLKARHVAEAALFLASDDSAYVSGHNLLVDGGFSVIKN